MKKNPRLLLFSQLLPSQLAAVLAAAFAVGTVEQMYWMRGMALSLEQEYGSERDCSAVNWP
jgi:hypothetical protein